MSLFNRKSLDLHGETKDIARILIDEFLKDSHKLGEKEVAIVHGIGSGILKKEVQKILKTHFLVESFYIDFFNIGQTIVILKDK